MLRLRSPPPPPAALSALAGELEESVRRHAVTLVLQRRPEEPDAVLVAALPSRDLSWELARLRGRGYAGVPGASSQLAMREGDRLLLRFSGNVAATGDPPHRSQVLRPELGWECFASAPGCGGADPRLTFHAQMLSQVLLRLAEVDPYGNYSSPHYKGAASVYKVTRDGEQLDRPVCTLSLTLPKVRTRSTSKPRPFKGSDSSLFC